MRIQWVIQLWTVQNALTSYKRKTRETIRGAWKKRTLDGQPMIHTFVAHLWPATGRIHKLQAPRS